MAKVHTAKGLIDRDLLIASEFVRFDPPLRGTAATAMNVALLTTATATIVSAQGYTGA